jgi:hypothetical protein
MEGSFYRGIRTADVRREDNLKKQNFGTRVIKKLVMIMELE